MKLAELSVKYKVATFMLYISLMVLGTVALYRIPIEFMPKMDIPFINIIVTYPNSSPIEICENIVEPIEEEVSTMHGIDKIETRCRQGNAEIGMQLTGDSNSEYQVLEVRERIEQIRNELPKDLPPIIVTKFATDQFPIIFASIGVPNTNQHYTDLFEQLLVRPLKTVGGVADIQFFGMEEKRVKVEMDQDSLDAHNLSVIEVYGKLAANNMNMSLGSINYAEKKYSVRLLGQLERLDDVRRLRIRPDLSLSDIARVDYEYVKPVFHGRINGKPAYLMLIQKEAGANTVEVSRQVMSKIDQLLKDPQLQGSEIKVWFSQAKEIERAVSSLKSSGLIGAFLAFFMLLLFIKDWRATFIITLSIPTSLLITVFVMYFMGYTFNVITLSGLVMGIGMLVDNAIVVMEVVYAHLERGADRNTAAINGTNEVGLAITASTSTTMIVFLPLIFSRHKEVSVMMGQLGMVVVISITASLLVSLTLIPLLASIMIRSGRPYKAKWFQYFEDKMVGWLAFSLSHRQLTLWPLFGLFMVCMALFFMPQVVEKESIPKAMMNVLQVRMNFEQKPSEQELDEKAEVLEKLFMAHKQEWELDAVNSFMGPMGLRVSLVLKDERSRGYNIDDLREKAKAVVDREIKWPGVQVSLETQSMSGPGGGPSPTTIKVKGDAPDQVFNFAELIRARLKSLQSIKELGELEKEGQREAHIVIDRELAQKYGFDPSSVAFSVAYMIRGASVGKFTSADRQIDLYFQLEEADRRTMAQLKEMGVRNNEGKQIPLKNIAKFEIKGIPDVVRRENRRFTVRIPVFPKGRDLSRVRDEALARLADIRLPKGYIWTMGEEYEDMMNMLYDLLLSVLLATILVFIVMTAQFESMLLPFVVMFTIPLAAIGVVLALIMTHSTFNILSGAGALLLIGIVVNNAIVLVDHVHNLRKQGVSDRESLLRASQDRMRPITMTALCTIMGVIPLALGMNDAGGMVYSPLGIAVMGGMIVSTFFTPLAIPVIFSLADSLRDAFKKIAAYLRQNETDESLEK